MELLPGCGCSTACAAEPCPKGFGTLQQGCAALGAANPTGASEVEKDQAEKIADVALQLTQVCTKQRMKLKIVCPLKRNKTSKQESSPEVAL